MNRKNLKLILPAMFQFAFGVPFTPDAVEQVASDSLNNLPDTLNKLLKDGRITQEQHDELQTTFGLNAAEES